MDKVKDSLEDRLEALRGPAMPSDVEAHIRQRLLAETGRRPSTPARGGKRRALPVQWMILAVLLLTAAWVVRQEVMPALRAAWERAHCLVEPTKEKQDP